MLDTNLAQAAVVYVCMRRQISPFFLFSTSKRRFCNAASTKHRLEILAIYSFVLTKTLQTPLCSTNINAVYSINVYQKSSNQILRFTKHDQTVMNFEKFGIKNSKLRITCLLYKCEARAYFDFRNQNKYFILRRLKLILFFLNKSIIA